MSAALWRQSGRPRDPAQLCRMRLLHDRDPNTSWQLWRQKYGPAALDVRRGRALRPPICSCVCGTGLGVALARHRLAHEELASGALVRPFETRAHLRTYNPLCERTFTSPSSARATGQARRVRR